MLYPRHEHTNTNKQTDIVLLLDKDYFNVFLMLNIYKIFRVFFKKCERQRSCDKPYDATFVVHNSHVYQQEQQHPEKRRLTNQKVRQKNINKYRVTMHLFLNNS